MYDNVKVKVAESADQDFRAFLKQDSALKAQSAGSKGVAEEGPSRHKSAMQPVTFASSLASRDWTSPDENYLRASFWGSLEFASEKDNFERLVDPELSRGLKAERLFCERLTACKPLYQCIGILLTLFEFVLFRFTVS